MKIAICQTNTLPLKENALMSYFKHFQRDSLVVFSEYAFDLFFTDLQKTSKELIAQLSSQKILLLQKIAKIFKITIVMPLIIAEESKIFKKIAVIDSKKTQFYVQQKLINYSHWNEEVFFDNPKVRNLKTPLIFEKNNFKIAVLFGFELHFDALWLKLKDKDVDIVLIPTASTLNSHERWQMLCRSRAFCNSCLVVRINRVGKVVLEDREFDFYGESLVVNPNAEIEEKLDHKESIAYVEIDKKDLDTQAIQWGFRKRNIKEK